MNSVIDNSNLGTIFLWSGQEKEALKMHDQAVDDLFHLESGYSAFYDTNDFFCRASTLQMPATTFQPIGSQSSSSSSIVYKYAAVTSAQPIATWANDILRMRYICRIQYNCALVHHVIALQQGNSALLKRSLRYYETAWSILMRSTEENEEIRLSMAILNNMAQIHNELCDYDAAKKCYDQVCNTVSHSSNITSFVVLSNEGQYMYDSHSADMYLNAVLLGAHPPCAQAA